MVLGVLTTVLAMTAEGWPRVVRHEGVTCVEFAGDEGTLREACRPVDGEYSGHHRPVADGASYAPEAFPGPPPRPPLVRTAPRARWVGDFGFSQLLVGDPGPGPGLGSQAVPGWGATGALGVRLPSGLGVLGRVEAQVFSGRVLLMVAPELSVGDTHWLHVALGPSAVLEFAGRATPAGSLVLRIAPRTDEGFTPQVLLGASLLAEPNPRALFVFGAGLGGSAN